MPGEPTSHVVAITTARRRGRARAVRPIARPYDWSAERELRLTLPEVRLVVAALRDLRVEAADELADEITRHLTTDPSTD